MATDARTRLQDPEQKICDITPLAQNKRTERPVSEEVIRDRAARCEPPTLTEAHGLVMCPSSEIRS